MLACCRHLLSVHTCVAELAAALMPSCMSASQASHLQVLALASMSAEGVGTLTSQNCCAGGCSMAGCQQGCHHHHRIGQGGRLPAQGGGRPAGGHHVQPRGQRLSAGGPPERQQVRPWMQPKAKGRASSPAACVPLCTRPCAPHLHLRTSNAGAWCRASSGEDGRESPDVGTQQTRASMEVLLS